MSSTTKTMTSLGFVPVLAFLNDMWSTEYLKGFLAQYLVNVISSLGSVLVQQIVEQVFNVSV